MRIIFLCMIVFMQIHVVFADNDISGKKNPERDATNTSWNLSDIYANWDQWNADLTEVKQLMEDIKTYQGRLNTNPKVFIELMQKEEQLSKKFGRVFRYPYFMRQLNSLDQETSAKMQEIRAMYAEYATATSWISPEMLDIPRGTMEKWIETHAELEPYAFNLMNSYRLQEHVLTADKEKLMSHFSRPMGTASSVYDELSVSDIQFPEITLSTGEKVKLSHANYTKLLETLTSQEDRKLVFESYYKIYKDHENTYAAIYKGICEKDNAYAKARGYKGTLEAKLEGNNIPTAVYKSLTRTAYDNVAPLHKYMELRKQVMELDELHTYDLSTKFTDYNREYDFTEAVGMVKEAVKPLGEDYLAYLNEATKGGWIDVYEKPNKTSGAFSANVYGVHPYILLNWNKSLNHVFTLAHELGHSMHSIYSNNNQPYATHSYTIFVAEVASTFNEHLLLDNLIEQAEKPEERIALLQQAIENIWGTFYIQSLYADYEYQVHKRVENGQPVTAGLLNKIMGDLYNHYYGEAVTPDELTSVKWSRVPHFYGMPYYVYQYATSFSASSELFSRYKNGSKKEQQTTIEKYKTLLKSGGNDFPVNQLKKAGVDLTSTKPFEAVVAQMDYYVNELEKELKKL